MSTTTQTQCNFCGKTQKEVEKLIIANDAGICNECIELCSSILNKEKNDHLRKDKKISRALDANKIKEHLDQYVVGQDFAKMALSVAVVNHYKRLFFESDIELEKSNILMFGPTGSGKTLLAKTIARYLNVPFVIADATTLTEAGYVGDDVESVISRLFAEADNDVERCEQGIVFLDEIDKIGRKSESASLVRDVSGEGVQQALLKLVEGTKCLISAGGGKKHPNLDQVEINTKNILFIAGGAFTDLDKIIQNRVNNKSIGFSANTLNKEVDRTKVTDADFLKFGMIPEFTGRFPITVSIDELGLEDLTRILIEPRNSLIKQMQFYFTSDDIELEFTNEAVIAVAETALEMKTGARALRSVLEKCLLTHMYKTVQYKKSGVKKIRITADTVKYNTEPELITE